VVRLGRPVSCGPVNLSASLTSRDVYCNSTVNRSGLRNFRTCSAEQCPEDFRGPPHKKIYDVKVLPISKTTVNISEQTSRKNAPLYAHVSRVQT